MSSESLQKWHISEPWINAHCALGEGPFYEAKTKSLRFVDIKKNQLLTVSLEQGPESLKVLQLDTRIGVTADIAEADPQNHIVAGLKYGLALLDRKTGKYTYMYKLADEDNERLRVNDGAVDRKGRFWLGTMNDFQYGENPEGSLMRFDPSKGDDARTIVKKDLTIPNSIGWSPDGRIMYWTHTTAGTIFACDYSSPDGGISNERVFFQYDGPGSPDGFRVDVEGNLWSAVYGGAKVIKISPAGKLVGEISLPTNNITCPQFAGTELFITTASDEDGEGSSKEFGGGLFRVDVGVEGLPNYAMASYGIHDALGRLDKET